MKEIAYLADSVSADQIDSQDKKLLDEIKSSVHNCLIDIVGETRKPGRRKSTAKRKRSDSNTKDEDDGETLE